MLTSRGLPIDSTGVLKAEPGKLDINRREPGILFISLPIFFSLQTSDYDVIFDFYVDSSPLTTSFKEYNVIMA